MKIKFQFQDPLILNINLIENPAVDSWSDHFLSNGTRSFAYLVDPFQRFYASTELIQTLLDMVKDRLEDLESYDFIFTGATFPNSPEAVTRDWTNKLHRFFTHSQKHVNHCDFTGSLETITEHRKNLSMLLNDINECVHTIERYLPLSVPYIDGHNEVSITSQPTADDPNWWTIDPLWRQYHSIEHADVILGPQILGKTILSSYMDADDPNDWDTTGHYSNNGALQIILGPARRKDIYKSQPFIQWLEHHGLTADTAWYDFPIGNISNREIIPELIKKLSSGTRYRVEYTL